MINSRNLIYTNILGLTSKDCVVKLDQIRCISVNRLIEYRGRITDDDMMRIKKRIKLIFDIN